MGVSKPLTRLSDSDRQFTNCQLSATTSPSVAAAVSDSENSIMTDEMEIEDDYRTSLAELTDNQKPQINMLTMLAEENYVGGHGPVVVRVIEAHIRQVPPAQKLPALFLIDSILKNCPDTKYRELFSKNIRNIFVHIFQEGDERMRSSLYKTRKTWSGSAKGGDGLFAPSKLYAIDIGCNSIDPNWPIERESVKKPVPSVTAASSATPVSAHSVHVNPKFINQHTSNGGARASELSQEEMQLKMLQEQRERLALVQQQRGSLAAANANSRDPRIRGSASASSSGSQSNVHNTAAHDTDLRPAKPKASRSNEQCKSGDDKDNRKRSSDKSSKHSDHESKRDRDSNGGSSEKSHKKSKHHKDKKGRKEDKAPVREGSGSSRSSPSRSPNSSSVSCKKQRTEDKPKEDNSKLIKTEPDLIKLDTSAEDNELVAKEAVRIGNSPSPQAPDSSTDVLGEILLQQTQTNGEPLEKRPRVQSPVPPPFTVPPQALVTHTSAHNVMAMSHTLHPHMIAPTNLPGSHAFAPMAIPQPVVPIISDSRGLPLLSAPFPYAGQPMFGARQQPAVDVVPAPVVPAPAPVVPDIPANNRVFVDGRMYEVHFVNGSTAVIEREGLPFKIYFASSPRDVVIDGVAHRLAFGETKTVLVDGQQHEIKFGAPSRELYMGGFAFRGAFGGPAIFATINNVKHTIRLTGPPPDVQVEPEPSYDLARFLPSRQTNVPAVPVVSQSLPPPVPIQPAAPVVRPPTKSVVDDLVSSLLAGGFKAPVTLPNLNLPATLNTGSNKSPNRVVTPPIIPSPHSLSDQVAREYHPPPSLKDFSMRLLKIRYQASIDALYPDKQRCPNCGLRFTALNGDKYTSHLDWHFRENRRAQDTSKGQSRPWYMAAQDWVLFTDLQHAPSSAKSVLFENARDDDASNDGLPEPVVDAPAGEHSCAVCSEIFEQYWDEDTESWKLRNAIAVGDVEKKFYHPGCVGDVSLMQSVHGGHHDESASLHSLFAPSSLQSGQLPGLDVIVEDEHIVSLHKQEATSPTDPLNTATDPVVLHSTPVAPAVAEPVVKIEPTTVKQESVVTGGRSSTPGTPTRDESDVE